MTTLAKHETPSRTSQAFDAITLRSPGGSTEAEFVPTANTLCCSLKHHGVEFLHRGAGVEAYAGRGITMGIPLLHRWARTRRARRCAALESPQLLELFPFEHQLRVEIQVGDGELTIATTLYAIGPDSVPVCFGYHPSLSVHPGHSSRSVAGHLLRADDGTGKRLARGDGLGTVSPGEVHRTAFTISIRRSA